MRLKRLQTEVQEERDNLLDLQKQQKQLIEFIVHDLKHPLSAIQVGLELLDDGDGTPTTQIQLRRLRDTAQYMGRRIQNILDIGRAEQVGLELCKTRIPLGSWIPHLLKEVDSQAQSRGLELVWECPADLEVEADQKFLQRLVLNLLDNALKYSPAGSCTRIEARSTAIGVRLEVRDQGYGIPEHMREQLFEKFVCLDEQGSHARSGSGLGLAFCQLVAEAHEGRIWVEETRPREACSCSRFPKAPPRPSGSWPRVPGNRLRLCCSVHPGVLLPSRNCDVQLVLFGWQRARGKV